MTAFRGGVRYVSRAFVSESDDAVTMQREKWRVRRKSPEWNAWIGLARSECYGTGIDSAWWITKHRRFSTSFPSSVSLWSAATLIWSRSSFFLHKYDTILWQRLRATRYFASSTTVICDAATLSAPLNAGSCHFFCKSHLIENYRTSHFAGAEGSVILLPSIRLMYMRFRFLKNWVWRDKYLNWHWQIIESFKN